MYEIFALNHHGMCRMRFLDKPKMTTIFEQFSKAIRASGSHSKLYYIDTMHHDNRNSLQHYSVVKAHYIVHIFLKKKLGLSSFKNISWQTQRDPSRNCPSLVLSPVWAKRELWTPNTNDQICPCGDRGWWISSNIALYC